MLFKNVSIHTVAHIEAPIRVTSAEISARFGQTRAQTADDGSRHPLGLINRAWKA